MKLLLPVDGSDNSLRATRFAITLIASCGEKVQLHVLNVQPPILSGDVKMFVSQDQIRECQHDEGVKALATVRELLDGAGITYATHIGVGQIAETVAAYAADKACDQIVMGSRGLGSVKGMLFGSVTTKVLHLVNVPVTLVK